MKTDQLTRWLGEEHRKVEETIYLVRKHLAVPPPSGRERWILELRECFRRMCDHMQRHMRLEETDGYMSEVRTARPTLTREIDRLHHEHGELAQLMSETQAAIDRLKPEDPLLIRSAAARVGMLLSYLEQHEVEENRLVLHVFSEELGAGD